MRESFLNHALLQIKFMNNVGYIGFELIEPIKQIKLIEPGSNTSPGQFFRLNLTSYVKMET